MNILDLKKLMLVPLVCCTSMQQVNAKVVHDKEREKRMQELSRRDDKQKDWFEEEVRNMRGNEAIEQVALRVAPLVQEQFPRVQHLMGGVVAAFPNGDKPLFFQGTKQDGMDVPNNNPDLVGGGQSRETKLLEVNDNSHTERQLIRATLDALRKGGGVLHVYTPEPPCRHDARNNGNFACVKYYGKLIRQFPNIKFHIYFDPITLGSLNRYWTFEDVDDLGLLCGLVSTIPDWKTNALGKWDKQTEEGTRDYKTVLNLCTGKRPRYLRRDDVIRIARKVMRCVQDRMDLRNVGTSMNCKDRIEKYFERTIVNQENGPKPVNLKVHIVQFEP